MRMLFRIAIVFMTVAVKGPAYWTILEECIRRVHFHDKCDVTIWILSWGLVVKGLQSVKRWAAMRNQWEIQPSILWIWLLFLGFEHILISNSVLINNALCYCTSIANSRISLISVRVMIPTSFYLNVQYGNSWQVKDNAKQWSRSSPFFIIIITIPWILMPRVLLIRWVFIRIFFFRWGSI